MGIKRTILAQLVKERLGKLQVERDSLDIYSTRYTEICTEIEHLRDILSDVMNSSCPLIEDGQ